MGKDVFILDETQLKLKTSLLSTDADVQNNLIVDAIDVNVANDFDVDSSSQRY
jgi:hypothetical protein